METFSQPLKAQALMSHRSHFRIELRFAGKLEAAFAALRLREMPKIHPLIEKLEISSEDETFTEAQITDRLNLSFLKFQLKYAASSRILRHEQDSVAFDNHSNSAMPFASERLQTHSQISVQQVGTDCLLVDETEVIFPAKAAWLPNFIWKQIQGYTLHNAEDSHRKMFANLAKLLAKES